MAGAWGGLAILMLGLAVEASAQSGPKPLSNPPGSLAGITNSHFKQVAPGVFQLGDIKLNSQDKTLSFPAVANMKQGPIEYLLVGVQGKIHESVLRTTVEPYHIHLGMLLLNAKGLPKDYVLETYAKPLPGDPISITVSWQENGQTRQVAGEELILDRAAKGAMAKGEWTYTGSRVFDGMFLAQRDRSIVAVIGDIDALVNNPRPRRNQDENWQANTPACPEAETPVIVTFRLLPPKPAKENPQ